MNLKPLTALNLGDFPKLEAYAGAYRYENDAHTERAPALALAALELGIKRFEGQGSTRHFEAGRTFSLIDRPLYGANTSEFNYAGVLIASHQRPNNVFTILAVEHHTTNNLGHLVGEELVDDWHHDDVIVRRSGQPASHTGTWAALDDAQGRVFWRKGDPLPKRAGIDTDWV